MFIIGNKEEARHLELDLHVLNHSPVRTTRRRVARRRGRPIAGFGVRASSLHDEPTKLIEEILHLRLPLISNSADFNQSRVRSSPHLFLFVSKRDGGQQVGAEVDAQNGESAEWQRNLEGTFQDHNQGY